MLPVTTPGLWVRDLRAGYGAQEVLSSLSFELAGGRISVILGPGGSGKTTLLRALRTGGSPAEFWHRGRQSLPAALPCLMRQKLEPGGSSLRQLLTGPFCQPRECGVVEACPDRTSLPWDGEDRRRPDRVLRDFWHSVPQAEAELLNAFEEPLDTLPISLARLAVFTAIAVSDLPSILLLDEPEADMEEAHQEWLVHKLREMRGRRTVVLVTHNLRMARAVADYAMLLIDGEIVEAAETPRFFEAPVHPRTRHFVRMGC